MDVSQYLEIFIDETSEHIQSLSDCIMTLEKEPENKDTINEIFRAAHSLKGMAGTMGFKRMQHLTHDMENVFQEVRSEKVKVTSEMIDILFRCLDAIEGYLETIKSTSDEGTEENEAIIAALNRFLEGSDSEAPKPAEQKQESAREEQAGGETEKKFLEVQFSDKDKDALRAAEATGAKLYGMTVSVHKDCLLKAARAFLVFKSVEEFGQIVVYNPSSQDIEDERFELDFNIFVSCDVELDKLLKAVESVSEIAGAVGEQVKCADLFGDAPVPSNAPAPTDGAQTPDAAVKDNKQAPAKAKTASKPVANRTVRVDIEKLDALMNQVSELIIAKNSLVSISSQEGNNFQSQTFHEQIEYLERITTSLHESVMKVRMVPIESVVNKFPRMIRDLSRKLNKKMELYMTGEDTELDRTVVDQIGDPLQHLLRNSADHGLESGELRKERGKPETGSINLNAFQEGNNVIIEVSDDGNGIDTESIRRKAI
ncbi:MAG: chemotaxis protein CheA, partial [Lachnospiraceae bacterium]|nr:chemotaxis protein CheA [Lachnospiraceae bacterium]